MVSIPACHAGDRSSILRLGEFFFVIKITEEITTLIVLDSSDVKDDDKASLLLEMSGLVGLNEFIKKFFFK